MLEFLELLVPKVHWGLKKMWKKFSEFAKKIDDLRRNFVQPTLSYLLPTAEALSNPATRWRSSIPNSRKTKVLKACTSKLYICLKQS